MTDLNDFTYVTTLDTADKLGIPITPHQAKTIAHKIVTTKFPVCVKEFLENGETL